MTRTEIAVVGMSGRFPGATGMAEFWHILANGLEGHTEFTDEDLLAAGVPAGELADPHRVRRRPVVADADHFDARFFGYTPNEATLTDPQQRLFLECSWEALESAGYDPDRFDGSIGVFGGGGPPTYWFTHANAGARALGDFTALLGNDKDFLAPRVSYKLNLRGPSISVQTGCSSSLVAVHLAVQSLLHGECEMALAGGATIGFPQRGGYVHHEGGVNSPDGHCRAFDAAANGTVPGDGVGVVLLKPLRQALDDGDIVHGVILGTAVNNDGALKAGFTAPSVQGQADVIAEALAVAEVEPESIGYVEAHGTGTPLGDAIEIAALTQAFGTDRRGYCALGTVKPNIGHTDTAAGALGLIKVLLAMRHGQLPPSVNCHTPNPSIGFAGTPFYVNTTLADWPAGDRPRRAGVSSFSVGGTNAHIVVEEAPARRRAPEALRDAALLVLSARSGTALRRMATGLATALRTDDTLDLADVCYTLQAGRAQFEHRMALVCRDRDTAVAALDQNGAEPVFVAGPVRTDPPVTFLFPGQGSQEVGMGRDLYATEPAFRAHVDECAEVLVPYLGVDLRSVLCPEPSDDVDLARRRLGETRLTQPALFVTEYALARLLMHWGVTPGSMLGHSVGEFVAACLAGVLSLPDALAMISLRGKLIQRRPPGRMLAVRLAERQVGDLLADGVSIAAVNGPEQVVVAGQAEPVAALAARLAEAGIQTTNLNTSHAFHSSLLDPVVDEFTAAMAGVELHPPRIPYLSNVTGDWIEPDQATDPAYWGRQLRETVRFADAVDVLRADPGRVLVEVGPGETLRGLVGDRPVVATLGRTRGSREPSGVRIARTLGQVWVRGVPVDWTAFTEGQRRNRAELPTYPFERQRYLAGAEPGTQDSTVPPEPAPSRPELTTPYVVPRGRAERMLAELWQEVMGVSQVGAHDNFFDLGGHSLLAAQLVARLNSRLPITVTVTDLLSGNQTVAGMAELVEQRLRDKLDEMSDDTAAALLQ